MIAVFLFFKLAILEIRGKFMTEKRVSVAHTRCSNADLLFFENLVSIRNHQKMLVLQ